MTEMSDKERREMPGPNQCDNCFKYAALYYCEHPGDYEGLALCEACDFDATRRATAQAARDDTRVKLFLITGDVMVTPAVKYGVSWGETWLVLDNGTLVNPDHVTHITGGSQ